MSSDVFHLLTAGGGIRFDTNRFSSDAQRFAPAKPTTTTKSSASSSHSKPSPPPSTQLDLDLDLPPELDFFSTIKNKNNPAFSKERNSTKHSKLPLDQPGVADLEFTTEQFVDPEFGSGPLPADQVSLFCRANRLKLSGGDVPAPLASWYELGARFQVHPALVRHIAQHGWYRPTPIQKASMAVLLSGRDVFANAPTGSGKTLAYCLPLLHSLGAPRPKAEQAVGARALVVAPTRELATQIHDTLVVLAYGKQGHQKGSKRWKIQSLGGIDQNKVAGPATQAHRVKAPDVLISTPLRLVQAVQEEQVDLREVQLLVLDEADRLLEDNFLAQMDSVLAAASHPARRTALFSATLPSGTEMLARTFTTDPVRVAVGSRDGASEQVSQQLQFVGSEEGKLWALRDLVQQGRLKPPALLFVQSNERANHLFHSLVYDGLRVDTMHAHRTPGQRQRALDQLKAGQTWVLIATDVLARGIDLQGIQTVLNYDFPQSTQTYIHRIGRTGRAGHTGEAITFFTTEDAKYLKLVVNVMRESGYEVPSWMTELKAPTSSERRKLRQKAVKRQDVREADGALPSHLRGNKSAKHPKALLENAPRKAGQKRPAADGDHNNKSQQQRDGIDVDHDDQEGPKKQAGDELGQEKPKKKNKKKRLEA